MHKDSVFANLSKEALRRMLVCAAVATIALCVTAVIAPQRSLAAESGDGSCDTVGVDLQASQLESGGSAETASVQLEPAAVSVKNPRVVAESSLQAKQLSTWDCVTFGTFPKDVVTDSMTIARLDAATGWDNNDDITLNGQKFRRVNLLSATHKGPDPDHYWDWTKYGWDKTSTRWIQKDGHSGYAYFKYAPIKWRVLEKSGTRALLISDAIIDCHPFHKSRTNTNWRNSTLRSWLNGYYNTSSWLDSPYFTTKSFVGMAFTDAQMRGIATTKLTSGDADKVFVLSLSEASGSAGLKHGFAKSSSLYDEGRAAELTQYARAMGAYTFKGYASKPKGGLWWLRNNGKAVDHAMRVTAKGYCAKDGQTVDMQDVGLRPAMWVSLSADGLKSASAVVSLKITKLKAGQKIVGDTLTYTVVSPKRDGTGTVRVSGVTTKGKKATSLTIPAKISYKGISLKVSGIGKKAFALAAKAKTIIVKSTSLTKARVAGSLTGSKVTKVAVRVSSASSSNAKYAKKYKPYFTKANCGRSVTLKAYTAPAPKPRKLSTLAKPRIVKSNATASGQKVTWDCVWLGSYPQSRVTNESAISRLKAAKGWSSNELVYNGKRYRRVGSGAKVKFFVYEPIKWRILGKSGNTCVLMTDKALASSVYDKNNKSAWATSSLRKWLNNTSTAGFAGKAFTRDQRAAMLSTKLTNADSIFYGIDGGSNTTDKLYLPSENDIYGTDRAVAYGFLRDPIAKHDEARSIIATPYAQAMGAVRIDRASHPTVWWWLRAPGQSRTETAGVAPNGELVRKGQYADRTGNGVVVMVRMPLSSKYLKDAGKVSSNGTNSEVPFK